ncbi:MAG: hypothetical protein K0S33_1823 [Bacteroidetes bacterium]|jgi:uncharacterized membrane protein YqaE (UPF0057 family)|nr:hypothetical protein [Bacteroidota bacterium]
MKKTYLLLAALGLVFLVSSCKNTMDVTKRRYTKGYHFDKHKSPLTPQEGVAKQSTKEPISDMEPVAQSLPASQATAPQIKGGIQENTSLNGFTKKTSKTTVSLPATEKNDVEQTTIKNKQLKQGTRVQQKESQSTGGGDSDVKMILCIILALFIPPLAMYLWDKQTDVWFIVDLILFLLLFSWFFLGPFGLLGLAAIVIAILRILDAL